MICPECTSAIVIQKPDYIGATGAKIYNHTCSRCKAELRIMVQISKSGDPELIKKWKNWLSEGREK